MNIQPPPCSFAGYVSEARKQLVQEWYDALPPDEHDELLDTVNYLASMPITAWRRPEFDKVDSPLCEIRCKAKKANRQIRVYGVFDREIRARFVMLLGNEAKKRSKDEVNQKLALKRLALLEEGKASTHEFVFEKGFARTN
jgi:hypothetical protein